MTVADYQWPEVTRAQLLAGLRATTSKDEAAAERAGMAKGEEQ